MLDLDEPGLVISRYDELRVRGSPAKVIQMYVEGTKPVLFLGEERHFKALENILQMLDLDYEMMDLPERMRGPSLTGKDYKVVGMGHAQMEGNRILIKKNSCSSDYGIMVHGKHLEEVRHYLDEFELEVV